ncbi:MAG: acyl-CoA dehydrogenase family protein, partial [SAR202 cluster bacterium]|nr:acyl-CoA dehydrogenase family protein [SAR202 cluster bacterium]
MDLGLTEAQQMLKNSAREFLETECPETYVRAMEEDERGYTPELWQQIADQGWLGLTFPEQYGGVGLNFVDLSILLEEMGRALLPGPYFSTVVLAGLCLQEIGSEEQKQEFLPRIAEGGIIVTLALTEPSARWDAQGVQTTATATDDGFTLNGTKLFVPNAHVSDYIIVAARTGEGEQDISLFIVGRDTPGIQQTLLKTIASDRQSELVFNNVNAPSSALLGGLNQGWATIEKALAWGAVGKCAEMVGGGQQVLDMTVEYAKQRVQFGRPIGSFQAIQHHCANMATDVEGSRYITYQAAWRLSEDLPAENEVAMAKAWVSDAYRRVCALGHQCHGAIGFTKEHNMQLYSRRAKAAELMFGDSDF